MDYAEVLANAKKNIGPNCKVCPDSFLFSVFL